MPYDATNAETIEIMMDSVQNNAISTWKKINTKLFYKYGANPLSTHDYDQ